MSALDKSEMSSSWSWILAAGVALMLLGAACLFGSIAATLITVEVLGWLLLASAVVAVVQAFRARSWSGFSLHLLSALFRGFTGYILVRYPLTGELGLTLLLASLFVVGGLFRAIASARVRFPLWGWSVVSGVVSVVLGIVVLMTLPAASSWFIGFAVGVDLLMDGAAVSAFAAAARRSTTVATPERA